MNRGLCVWLVIAACAPEERKVPVERPRRWIEYGRTSGHAMPYDGQVLTAVAVREAHVERGPTREFLMVAIEGLGALHVGDSFDSFVFVGDHPCGLVYERAAQRIAKLLVR